MVYVSSPKIIQNVKLCTRCTGLYIIKTILIKIYYEYGSGDRARTKYWRLLNGKKNKTVKS